MKAFYKRLKIFCAIAILFIWSLLTTVFCMQLLNGSFEWIIIIGLVVATALIIGVLILFGRYVDEVIFENEDVIVVTNTNRYRLSYKYFTKVRVENSNARIYIEYDDGKLKKTFVFYMIYTINGRLSLDIDYLKEHMPYTAFIEKI